MTAASNTSGCETARFSISIVRDPFSAGLDHILQAIGQLHIPIGIDRCDVAGGEPAVPINDLAAFALEIAGDHPVATHLQLAHRPPVMWQYPAVGANQAQFDTANPPSLLDLNVDDLVRGRGFVLRQQGPMVTIGLVSVMPHACSRKTPNRSRNVSIIFRGGAVPPTERASASVATAQAASCSLLPRRGS